MEQQRGGKTGMDVIWAPWRMEYILGDKEGGCFFCRLAGERPAAKNLLLLRTTSAMAVLNRFPYNNGHLMVAPLEHTADLSALSSAAYAEAMELFRFSLAALGKAVSPEGFNAGLNLGKVAGAGLEGHLHWHIVPRWHGDTNFMPVVSGTRVLPEALASTWEKLHPLFAEWGR